MGRTNLFLSSLSTVQLLAVLERNGHYGLSQRLEIKVVRHEQKPSSF